MNLISTDVLSEFNDVFSSDTLREENARAEEILLPMEEEEELMRETVDMLVDPSYQMTTNNKQEGGMLATTFRAMLSPEYVRC